MTDTQQLTLLKWAAVNPSISRPGSVHAKKGAPPGMLETHVREAAVCVRWSALEEGRQRGGGEEGAGWWDVTTARWCWGRSREGWECSSML